MAKTSVILPLPEKKDTSSYSVDNEWQLQSTSPQTLVLDVESGVRGKNKDTSRIRKSAAAQKSETSAASGNTRGLRNSPKAKRRTKEKLNRAKKASLRNDMKSDLAYLWKAWEFFILTLGGLPLCSR